MCRPLQRRAQTQYNISEAALDTAFDATNPKQAIASLVVAAARDTGACTINRPCAQQYVGKSQSCMVISGRLIVHAPVDEASRLSGSPWRACGMYTSSAWRRRLNRIVDRYTAAEHIYMGLPRGKVTAAILHKKQSISIHFVYNANVALPSSPMPCRFKKSST